MYIKKLDLMWKLIEVYSNYKFIDTKFAIDSNDCNVLITKVLGLNATITVFYNQRFNQLDTEINII